MAYLTQGAPQQQGINPMGQMPQGMPQPDISMLPGGQPDQQEPQQQAPKSLNRLLEEANIAEELDDELLVKIADDVWDGYQLDLQSKSEWDRLINDWINLASQVKENKTWPWPKAANVKYPLLSTAAMQFAARAYPALVPSDGKIVQMKVIGQDPDGQKVEKAYRLADHMNYQLKVDMKDWEEEMDRLLIMLPVVGCLFKKTYWDSVRKRNCSKLLGPKDLVINYWASSLDTAYRVTEVIKMTKNQITTMQNAGLYLDIDLPEPASNPAIREVTNVQRAATPSKVDATTPYIILEQHTYLDLDEDGYAEPYIVTIEEQSKTILRIVARWDSDGVLTNPDGDLVCIEPVQYYTKYEFIPNPDGGFYGVGFGHLLGPLNESANTLINLLIDAGVLSNLQSGFIGKGLKMKMGESKFTPGEWKSVPAMGDDLRKQIVPLPVKEPSEVLFKLLGLIIESSEKLASVAEIFVGKMPGQNTPATTTMATIEQGMKVFTAIYKRTYRALSQEFEKLFRLNSLYVENIERAAHILSEPITPQDYDMKVYNVCPSADPTAVSSTQKLMKAESLLQLLQLGTINPQEVTKRVLEAHEQPNIQQLMQMPQQPPDPKIQQMQAQMQMDQESHKMDMAAAQQKTASDQQKAMMDMKMDAQMKAMDLRIKEMEAQMKLRHEAQKNQMDLLSTVKEHVVDNHQMRQEVVQNHVEHRQKMTHNEEMHNAKISQQRDAARLAKSKGNGSSD